ncbi:hypothetical protein PoB_004495500 [Plakobranchus ocellatus]|uniref:Uncharacterized protein n=1 Tax=Plakobranchus ocellatus TaxID=259542 RepID=A0AAV4BH74_9GAST|nr:hypothetical protein PoB_004495500 [Plakobranchus ocellatus]
MDKFLTVAAKSLHHLVVTPAKYKVARQELYQPMKPILDRDGNVRVHAKFNFPMSTAIPEDDRMNVLACKWLTPAPVLGTLDPTPKLLVNKLKDFMNTSEIALFNHKPLAEPHPFCNFRKPEHLHILLHSKQQHLRDVPKYRGVERVLKANDCDIYTRKVIANEPKVYSYCINDPEKTFLGCNSKDLLFELNAVHGRASNPEPLDQNDCETVQSTIDDEVQEIAEPSRPPLPPKVARKRTYLQSSMSSQVVDDDDDDEDQDQRATKYMIDNNSIPQKRSKALQNLDSVKAALTKYPFCATFSDLVTACRGTPQYDTICSIYLDHRADKIWNLAREELVNNDEDLDLYNYLTELPDELKNTMTPMQTLALFNSWCEEQQVNVYKMSYCTFNGIKRADCNLKSVHDEATDITVTINHGGNTFPYWKRGASTCDEDFNQPNNVIGFRCQTEMWMFVDTKGDYGVPQIHDPDTEYGTRFAGHNDDFHNYFEGEIQPMPDRLKIWDKQVLLELGRSCNSYDHATKEYKIKDPNQIYDMTRHPGYKELSASDATAFAMDFTPGPGQQFNMFPHRQVADMNGIRGSTGIRFSTDETNISIDNGQKYMCDWPINYVKTTKSASRYGHDNDGGVTNQIRLAYFQSSIGCNGKQDDTCLPYRHPTQQYTYHKSGPEGGTGKDMQVKDAKLDDDYGGYACTQYILSGLTPDGHGNNIKVRPPYFMFGVHPDFERRSAGIFPYNYFANLNVTYHSTVEWLIASPAPSWIPLGPGGVKNLKQSDIDPKKKTPIQRAYSNPDSRVVVGGRYDGLFTYGANYI